MFNNMGYTSVVDKHIFFKKQLTQKLIKKTIFLSPRFNNLFRENSDFNYPSM